jgi:O-antigen/teichoic acid export membrane protein
VLRKTSSIRIVTNLFGLVCQVLNIFILTTMLDIFQFALWGISLSLISIFSQVFQFSFFQNIERFFPNYDFQTQKIYFIGFVKVVSLLAIPLGFSTLFILDQVDFFKKYNADNIIYLFILVVLCSLTESIIALLKAVYVAIEQSNKLDITDSVYFKVLRLSSFYILLYLGYSLYYLLLTNLILRLIMVMRLCYLYGIRFIDFKKKTNYRKILKNLEYSFYVFVNHSIYIFFLNLLFLITSVKLLNFEVAYFSLAILIISNLRPVADSISTLISPIILKNKKTTESKMQFNNFIIFSNMIFATLIVNFSIVIVNEKIVIEFFLDGFNAGIYKIILLSIFSSTLRSTYYPKLLFLLFNGNEKYVLKVNIFNCLTSFTIFYFLLEQTNNFIYVYIFYELIFYISINIKNFILSKDLKLTKYFSMSYLFTLLQIMLFVMNIVVYEILVLVFILVLFDSYKFIKNINNVNA